LVHDLQVVLLVLECLHECCLVGLLDALDLEGVTFETFEVFCEFVFTYKQFEINCLHKVNL
jgi:hypothetical protein